jgi:hypothetical protein
MGCVSEGFHLLVEYAKEVGRVTLGGAVTSTAAQNLARHALSINGILEGSYRHCHFGPPKGRITCRTARQTTLPEHDFEKKNMVKLIVWEQRMITINPSRP